MDAEQAEQLRSSIATVFATSGDATIRQDLTRFGWIDLLREDVRTAVSLAAEMQGRHLRNAGVIDDVAAVTIGDGHSADNPSHLICPPLGHRVPASSVDSGSGRLILRGVATTAREGAHRFIAPASDGGRVVMVTGVLPRWPGAGSGLDPDSGFCRIDLDIDLADVHSMEDGGHARWPDVEAGARRALAHELIGISSEMLDMTVEHVTSRQQFGRAIVEFQAVRHKLADIRLWLEVATLAADAAWEDHESTSAALAKSLAGRLAGEARVNCQQLLGGMGFTWEHRFHRYLRRALLSERLLGDPSDIRTEVGRRLLATAELPVLAIL